MRTSRSLWSEPDSPEDLVHVMCDLAERLAMRAALDSIPRDSDKAFNRSLRAQRLLLHWWRAGIIEQERQRVYNDADVWRD